MKNLKETIKEFGKTYINGGNGIAFDFYMTLNIEDAGLLDTICDIVDELTLNDEWEEIEINNDDIEISTERQAKKITSEQQEQQEKGDKIENIKNTYDVKEFIKVEARRLDICYFEKDCDGDYVLSFEGKNEILDLLINEVGEFDLLKYFVRGGIAEMDDIKNAVYNMLLENEDFSTVENLIYYDDIIDEAKKNPNEEITHLINYELYECIEYLISEIMGA